MDGQNNAFRELGVYDWLIARVYPKPRLIVDAPKPWQNQPYAVNRSEFTNMHTTQIINYSAPSYGWKANMLYPTSQPQWANYGSGTGQAPTSGVYTGIPSGCGPNGMPQGAPYS